MSKILLLSSAYKSSGSANGICAQNLALEFKRQGHNVCVISTGFKDGLTKYIDSDINPHKVEQWLMMAEKNSLGELYDDFLQKDVTQPMYSKTGCLLLLANGFRSAAARRDEIVAFLKS